MWLFSLFLALIFATALLGGYAGVAIARHGARGRPSSLALLEAASGGVFLGLSLVHLLPEATDALVSDGVHRVVPPSLAVLAFVVLMVLRGGGGHAHGGRGGKGSRAALVGDDGLPAKGGARGRGDVVDVESGGISVAVAVAAASEEEEAAAASRAETLERLTVVVSICVHSLLEGMLLSMQTDTRAFVSLGIGILAHKWALAASVFGYVAATYPGAWMLADLAAVAVASPAGAVAGMYAVPDVPASVPGVCNAVAAGVFLFGAHVTLEGALGTASRRDGGASAAAVKAVFALGTLVAPVSALA